jgi:hypothetical protein
MLTLLTFKREKDKQTEVETRKRVLGGKIFWVENDII